MGSNSRGEAAGGAAPADPAAPLSEVDPAALPSGATAEPYVDGTFTGSCVTVPFAATEDIAATLGAVAGSAGQAGWLAAEDAASQQARALGELWESRHDSRVVRTLLII